MKFSKDQLEALYKKGHISEASYAKLCYGGTVKKMADGGPVEPNQSTPSSDQVAAETAPQTGMDLLQNLAATQNKSEADAPNAADPGILDTLKSGLAKVGDRFAALQDNIGKVDAAKAAGQDVDKMQFKDGNVVPASTAEGPQAGAPSTGAPPLASDMQKPDAQGQLGDLSRQLMGEGYHGMDQALGMKEDAIRAGAAAGAKQAAAEAGYLGEQASQLKSAAAAAQVKADTQKSAEDDALSKYNKVNDDFQKMAVDPDHFHKVWQDKSTGSKVLSFIGLALMGRAAPERLNQMIQTDIDAQKANIATAKAGVDHTYNAYEMLRQQGLDSRQAEMGARSIAMDSIAMQTKAMMAKYQSPMVQANGASMLADIENQKAQAKVQMASSIANSPAMLYKDKTLQRIAAEPNPKIQAQALTETKVQAEREKTKQNISSVVDQMADLQKNGNKLLSPLQTRSLMDAYNLQISGLAKEMYGRVNPSEIQGLKDGASVRYTDDPETIAKKKALVLKFLDQHMVTPTLDSMGLGTKGLDLKPL